MWRADALADLGFDSSGDPDETLQELAMVEPVGTAETEHEGKQWLAQNDEYWDLAIVDLFLKEGSGLKILEACRARRPDQKMIVLSNHATRDIRWRCAQLRWRSPSPFAIRSPRRRAGPRSPPACCRR